MIKKALISVFCAAIALLLCSCYDYKELKNYTFVMGLGIDIDGSDSYKVTAELGCMSDGGDQVRDDQTSVVISRRANSLELALALLTDTTGGELYFKNCEIAVLGETLCENGIKDIIEYFVQSPNFQKSMTVASAAGSAEDIFEVEPTADSVISTELARSIKSGEQSLSNARAVPPYSIYEKTGKGGHIAVTRLAVKSGGKKTVEAGGYAIFQDYRQICTLNIQDAVFYSILNGGTEHAVIDEGGGFEISSCDADIRGNAINIRAYTAGNQPAPEGISKVIAERTNGVREYLQAFGVRGLPEGRIKAEVSAQDRRG